MYLSVEIDNFLDIFDINDIYIYNQSQIEYPHIKIRDTALKQTPNQTISIPAYGYSRRFFHKHELYVLNKAYANGYGEISNILYLLGSQFIPILLSVIAIWVCQLLLGAQASVGLIRVPFLYYTSLLAIADYCSQAEHKSMVLNPDPVEKHQRTLYSLTGIIPISVTLLCILLTTSGVL